MEKKIVVPSGMVDAAYGKAIEDADGKVRYSPVDAVKSHERLGVERILEAALRWFLENLPTRILTVDSLTGLQPSTRFFTP